MRRKEKELSTEDTLELLKNTEYGVLSTVDSEGLPYGVPMSYAYEDGNIYMHGTVKESMKKDNIAGNPKASFTVVDHVELEAGKFTTKFMSAIAFGKVELVKDDKEKQKGLEALIKKYSPDFLEKGMKYIASDMYKTEVYRFHIENVTGKGRQ